MQKMFLDEVTERSARLVEGAQTLRAGSVTPQEAGDLLREGHTIKGTGRVMGYEDVGSAGLMLEMIWRWIQHGDITPVPIFGRVLEALSAAIPNSLDDPAALSEAMAAVHDFFDGQTLPEELPPPPEVVAEGGNAEVAEPVEAEAAVPVPIADLVGAEAVVVEPVAGAAEQDNAIVRFGDPDPPVVAEAPAVEPEAEATLAEIDEPEVAASDVAAAVSSEPVLSAHEMFAQLAAGDGDSEEPVAEDAVVEDAVVLEGAMVVESDEAVDGVGDDVVSSEPVLSAQEMFAQLAAGDGDSEEPVAEDAVVFEAETSADVIDEDVYAPLDDDEQESEEDAAARSAQDAFAELRRSMAQEDAAAELASPPDDHRDVVAEQIEPAAVVAISVDAVESEPATSAEDDFATGDQTDTEPGTEGQAPGASTDETSTEDPADEAAEDGPLADKAEDASDLLDEPAARDKPIGSVIDFPVSDADTASVDPIDGDSVDVSDPEDDDETTDVVVLPSNRMPTPRGAPMTDDLGGLVGAVQTWAAEEPISVNTGRLYGLVNHIVSLRMDIESAKAEVAELAELAAADPFFSDRVSHIAAAIEPIAESSDTIEAQALALAAAPLRDVTNTLPQLGRYLSRKTGKELSVEIVGDDILVDRQVLDRLGDAIRQLVVNAAVHGIEDIDTRLGAAKRGTGTIRIEASQTDVNLEVSVVDDGRGIDWQGIREKGLARGLLESSSELAPDALRSLLYQSGFTTQEAADELSGDGDGLAIVRDAMNSLNGSLRLESTPKVETRISMIVPVHQAMQKALLVRTAGIMWGIPETGIVEVVDMNLATIVVADHTTVLERVDGDVPFASFADLMSIPSDAVPASIVVATSAAGPVALGVEEVVGVRRVAAKELGAVLADAEADVVTGAALLGGDQVVLLVDLTRLAERQREAAIEAPSFPAARVLIVDDSVGVQQVVSSALATSGFNTSVASSVADALGALQTGTIDGIVVDFSMPRADGVALAHMVRQRHGDLPIVMLSGVAEGEDVDRARDAGVDAFFNKADFREGGLAEKLRALITERRAKEQTA